jgi:hypothetical protein
MVALPVSRTDAGLAIMPLSALGLLWWRSESFSELFVPHVKSTASILLLSSPSSTSYHSLPKDRPKSTTQANTPNTPLRPNNAMR